MKKKEIKKIAERIGMSQSSVKHLAKRGLLHEDMTEQELNLFIEQKEAILDEIAQEYTGFKRIKEIPTRLLMANKDGLIMNGFTGRILKPALTANDGKGYKAIVVEIQGQRKIYVVHRLVASCFCPNYLEKGWVHHINGDRLDNRAENLLCVHPKEHSQIHTLRELGFKNTALYLERAVLADNLGTPLDIPVI